MQKWNLPRASLKNLNKAFNYTAKVGQEQMVVKAAVAADVINTQA